MKDFDPAPYLNGVQGNGKANGALVHTSVLAETESAVQAVEAVGLDLTVHYHDWLKIGFALASLGEAGREFYHRVSRLSGKYTWQECDTKFDQLLKSYTGMTGIATFFHYCKAAGITWKKTSGPAPTPQRGHTKEQRKDGVPAPGQPSYLEKVLATRELIKRNKTREIVFSAPILKQDDKPVLFPNTINTIQGQAGVHKSRLAETICSALLKRPGCESTLLQFTANPFKSYSVCYVDTERNLTEQLPYALQQIQRKAGYAREEHPANFDYISLLDIPRKERFSILTQYLHHVRQTFSNHLLVVLDVTTDCIRDFNRSDDSLELIDLMNEAINTYDVTFLCLIHENPGASKARGHLGTELMNKSSTVIQVGFERDGSGNETDLIRIKYLKCRSTRRPEPFFVSFSETEKGLVVADKARVQELADGRRQKARHEEMVAYLEQCLTSPLSSHELVSRLMQQFGAKDRTIRDRLAAIIAEEVPLCNGEGKAGRLVKGYQGRELMYWVQQ